MNYFAMLLVGKCIKIQHDSQPICSSQLHSPDIFRLSTTDWQKSERQRFRLEEMGVEDRVAFLEWGGVPRVGNGRN